MGGLGIRAGARSGGRRERRVARGAGGGAGDRAPQHGHAQGQHTVDLAPLLARIPTGDQFEFGIRVFLAGLAAQRPA